MSVSSVRDSSFFFRTRRRGGPSSAPGGDFLHGFVFCRQRQDERLRRGGEQRSVVVLSLHPLSCVLAPLCRYVGPLVLSYGNAALGRLYAETAAWPPLAWGADVALPIGMITINAELPEGAALPCPPLASSGGAGAGDGGGVEELDDDTGLPLCLLPAAYGQQELVGAAYEEVRWVEAGGSWRGGGRVVLQWPAAMTCCREATLPLTRPHSLLAPPFMQADVYTPLRAALPALWTLWELMALGEPLMVVAPSPGAAAACVAALVSLLAPLPYCLDYRPYFTIHDPAFRALAAHRGPGAAPGGPTLIGVTNMYFVKVGRAGRGAGRGGGRERERIRLSRGGGGHAASC